MNLITSNTEVVRINIPFSRHFLATRDPTSLTRAGTEEAPLAGLLEPAREPETMDAAEIGSV